jgi:hypothetical protein
VGDTPPGSEVEEIADYLTTMVTHFNIGEIDTADHRLFLQSEAHPVRMDVIQHVARTVTSSMTEKDWEYAERKAAEEVPPPDPDFDLTAESTPMDRCPSCGSQVHTFSEAPFEEYGVDAECEYRRYESGGEITYERC